MREQSDRKRIRIISFFIVVFALLLVGRLYMLQIVRGEAYDNTADKQYSSSVRDMFNRGNIFFTAKDGTLVSAASLKTHYTIVINPSLLKEPEKVYEAVNGIVPIEKDDFLKKAEKTTDPHEELAKKVDEEKAKQITDLKIKGLFAEKERSRMYPHTTLASHVLGFVGYKENIITGRYGLEKYYNDVLERGVDDVYTNFFAEMFSNIKTAFSPDNVVEGDLVTTIEPTVEEYLEKEIKKISSKWNPKVTGGIVINPKTGEIYAMASSPDFDPNEYQKEESVSVFTNPLVENVYEMGSIFKPLTMAAGIDAGVVTAHTTYNDTGSLTLNSATIYNFDKKGRGVVDMQEVINHSLNTGAAYVAKKLGAETFTKYMKSFGIGEETGIDLPNESAGIVKNLLSGRDIEIATASYGQGIAVTPIAITRALSVLANGGNLVTPYIVKEIDKKSGLRKIISYEPKNVLAKTTTDEISRMLVTAVDTSLLEGTAKMEHYSIAAKTGTAQIPDPKAGGYHDDKFLHSFVGYFPAYNPQFLIFLFAVEPKGVSYASHSLTEPFMSITKFLINYYTIPPDR